MDTVNTADIQIDIHPCLARVVLCCAGEVRNWFGIMAFILAHLLLQGCNYLMVMNTLHFKLAQQILVSNLTLFVNNQRILSENIIQFTFTLP